MHARRRHRTAKTVLRDYINAMVGFTDLAEAIHIRAQASQSQPDLETLIANGQTADKR